jgi:hypothetical protein
VRQKCFRVIGNSESWVTASLVERSEGFREVRSRTLEASLEKIEREVKVIEVWEKELEAKRKPNEKIFLYSVRVGSM